MHSRFGPRRPDNPRRPSTLAAAWAVIAAFLAALAAQALAQASHNHPAPAPCAAVCDSPGGHGHHHDQPRDHGPTRHTCPVCEKSCLAKAGLAPPPASAPPRLTPAATDAPAWAPADQPPARTLGSPRARGPPRAA
jgi:hypothetical protein